MKTQKVFFMTIALPIAAAFIVCAQEAAAADQARELWTNMELGSHCLVGDNIKGTEIIELAAFNNMMSVLISGKNGEMKDRVSSFSYWVRFGDVDGDGDLEIVQTVDKMLGTTKSIAYFEPAWGDWKEIQYWERQTAQTHTIHDFDGDGNMEILGGLGMDISLIDIQGNNRWARGSGPHIHTVLADVTGNGFPEIAAVIWKKKPGGKFRYASNMIEFYYDLIVGFIDPANGEIMSTIDEALDIPSTFPIAADLSGSGMDDVIITAGDTLYIIRGQEVYTKFNYEIEAEIAELKEQLGDRIDISDSDGYTARAKLNFMGMAVGDFNPSEGLEIVTTTDLGHVVALDAEGEILWENKIGVGGDPVIADFNGDTNQEVIVPLQKGSVVAVDGTTGEEIYSFTPAIKPKYLFVADVNSDGNLDVVVSHGQGIAAWTMDVPGKIEWATKYGDAAGTGNYKLSRGYVNRIADTRYIILFPYFKEGLQLLGLIVLAGGIIYGIRRFASVRTLMQAPELAGPLARLEKAYSQDPNSPNTVIPLAREYAKSSAIGIGATDVYRKALNLAPNDNTFIIAGAKAFLARQMFNPENEKIYQMALSLIPNDTKFLEGLVRLYCKNHRVDSFAMTVFHRYFSGQSYDRNLLKLAVGELSNSGCKDAFSSWMFQLALTNDPGNVELLMVFLGSLKELNKADEYLLWAFRYISDPRLNNDMRGKIVEDLNQWGMSEDANRFLPTT